LAIADPDTARVGCPHGLSGVSMAK
jgi:hypothetical protein